MDTDAEHRERRGMKMSSGSHDVVKLSTTLDSFYLKSMHRETVYAGRQPRGSCSETSRSDDEFSDSFEDRIDHTESFTTETLSLTSSPSLLSRYFDNAGFNPETESLSTTSEMDFQSGRITSLFRTRPDGESSPDDVVASERKAFRYTFPSNHTSSTTEPQYTEEKTPFVNNSPHTLSPSHFMTEEENRDKATADNVTTVPMQCPARKDTGPVENAIEPQTSGDPVTLKTDIVRPPSGDNKSESSSSDVSISRARCGNQMDPKDVRAHRSFSLPNTYFNYTNQNMSICQNEPKTMNATTSNTLQLGLGMCKMSSPDVVVEPDTTISILNTSNSSEHTLLKCSRRESSNASDDIDYFKGYENVVHCSSPEPGPQNMRKHLPNPFNKVNHRFHSTLHCPCFLFFCFLCCYPAVYLMQMSDVQFISGEDDLARKSGKRATVMYIVGAVSSVLFISTLLFIVYYFVGDKLIKAPDS